MKKLVLLAAVVAIGHTGFSQISIDPEIGMNISNNRLKISDNDAESFDSKIGISAGVGVTLGLTKNVYLRPGIYYQNLGNKTEAFGTTSTTNYHYLRVPVNIGYNYMISNSAGSVFVEAGPYVGYALAGKTKTELLGVEVKTDIEFGDGIGETKPFDWGFNFGLGYESPWDVYVKGGYGLGLGNLTNINDVKMSNRHFNIALGYKIKL